MSRQRFNFETGVWESVDKRPTLEGKTANIITDSMDATWHPCDGKKYDSKSQFRRTTKANGCIEYGNEDPRKHIKRQDTSRRDRQEALIRSYEQVASGNAARAMSKKEFDRFD